MKRSGFKRPVYERARSTTSPIHEHLRRSATYAPAELAPVPKVTIPQGKTAEDKRHMDAVAQIGCVVCRRVLKIFTPLVELHHPRRGTGMGQRAAHQDVLPLCFEHHRGNSGIHGLGSKGFEKRYGFTEADLLGDVRTLLQQ